MASNEFRACKKAIKRATCIQDIETAIATLDSIWWKHNCSKKIMRDKDWKRLTIILALRSNAIRRDYG